MKETKDEFKKTKNFKGVEELKGDNSLKGKLILL